MWQQEKGDNSHILAVCKNKINICLGLRKRISIGPVGLSDPQKQM